MKESQFALAPAAVSTTFGSSSPVLLNGQVSSRVSGQATSPCIFNNATAALNNSNANTVMSPLEKTVSKEDSYEWEQNCSPENSAKDSNDENPAGASFPDNQNIPNGKRTSQEAITSGLKIKINRKSNGRDLHEIVSSGKAKLLSNGVSTQSNGLLTAAASKSECDNEIGLTSNNRRTRKRSRDKKTKGHGQNRGNESDAQPDLNGTNNSEKSEEPPMKKTKLEPSANRPHRHAGTSTASIATSTEPDLLGPCEPGTSVTLEGIVWHETSGGVLVVNVTWRGKTYVGSLLDITQHDWAPPAICDSSPSDVDATRSPLKFEKLQKRGRNGLPSLELDGRSTLPLRGGKTRRGANFKTPSSPARSDSSVPTTGKRKGRVPNSLKLSSNASSADLSSPNEDNKCKRGRRAASGSSTPGSDTLTAPMSPPLLECAYAACGKKFSRMEGLQYHQQSQHSLAGSLDENSSDAEKSISLSAETSILKIPPEKQSNCGEDLIVDVCTSDQDDLSKLDKPEPPNPESVICQISSTAVRLQAQVLSSVTDISLVSAANIAHTAAESSSPLTSVDKTSVEPLLEGSLIDQSSEKSDKSKHKRRKASQPKKTTNIEAEITSILPEKKDKESSVLPAVNRLPNALDTTSQIKQVNAVSSDAETASIPKPTPPTTSVVPNQLAPSTLAMMPKEVLLPVVETSFCGIPVRSLKLEAISKSPELRTQPVVSLSPNLQFNGPLDLKIPSGSLQSPLPDPFRVSEPPSEGRASSPAYSDISEDNEDTPKITKDLDSPPKPTAAAIDKTLFNYPGMFANSFLNGGSTSDSEVKAVSASESSPFVGMGGYPLGAYMFPMGPAGRPGQPYSPSFALQGEKSLRVAEHQPETKARPPVTLDGNVVGSSKTRPADQRSPKEDLNKSDTKCKSPSVKDLSSKPLNEPRSENSKAKEEIRTPLEEHPGMLNKNPPVASAHVFSPYIPLFRSSIPMIRGPPMYLGPRAPDQWPMFAGPYPFPTSNGRPGTMPPGLPHLNVDNSASDLLQQRLYSPGLSSHKIHELKSSPTPSSSENKKPSSPSGPSRRESVQKNANSIPADGKNCPGMSSPLSSRPLHS